MKKVINITIGSLVFTVEDDAYEKLSEYLNSIKKYFSTDKDGDEIVEDLEANIAEKFSKRKNKNGAVTEKDVSSIIEQIGTLKDFKKMSREESEDEETEESQPTGEKKLYRDPDDAIIAGICSGLGAYFGIETVLVRLIFFVTIFFGGFGVLGYLILWVVMPVAETTAQKAEMRGERLTLHEIEKSVKRGVENLKKKDLSGVRNGVNKIENLLKKLFPTLGKLFWQLLDIAGALIGLALMGASIAGIFAISFGLTWQLSGGTIPGTTYTFNDFIVVSSSLYWLFLIALYLTLILPLLFIFFTGLSFIKKNNVVNMYIAIALLMLWFASSGLVASIVAQNQTLIEQRIEEVQMRSEWQ